MSQVVPAPVLPYAAAYSTAADPSPRRSRLVRLGGWCALLALALTLLFAPLGLFGRPALADCFAATSSDYARLITQNVPLFQALLLSTGLLLTAAGMLRTGGEHCLAYLLALALNGLATAGLWLEITRAFPA
jgi:Na+-driven multidrug efflux pump